MLVAGTILALQVLGGTDPAAERPDSVYATPELAATVAAAVQRNRDAPADLAGYGARVESEIAYIIRREDASEAVGAVEQLASRVRWQRPGIMEQEVVGYRAQALGPHLSALSFLERPWLVPSLYGNRIALFFGRDTSASGRRRAEREEARRERSGRPPVLAVHPLAEDAAAIYRYSGGDTVAVVRVQGRSIPVVRILVEPRTVPEQPTLIFRGEMDLDVSRHQLVRMRGQFVTIGRDESTWERLRGTVMEPLAFVELEAQELHERYWLPARQRVELQVAMPLSGDARIVMRVVSNFRIDSLDVRDAPEPPAVVRTGRDQPVADSLAADTPARPEIPRPPGDSLRVAPFTLSMAPADSLASFGDWRFPIGTATESLNSSDFDDVAPDRYRSTGQPRLEFGVERSSDLAHFNRVEGVFTGVGARWRLRDALPGFEVRANAGWAWSEQTPRGRLAASLDREAWRLTTTVGRRLDMTNDFRTGLDSGSSGTALLFSEDDYDYLDRRFADLRFVRRIAGPPNVELGVELGAFEDAAVVANLTRGIARGDGFRPNRGIDEGRYARGALTLRLNPTLVTGTLGTGTMLNLRWEVARGELAYERAEASIGTRANRGRWTLAGRVDVGATMGDDPPPQQLFEIGGAARLPGHEYKEFAGNNAVVYAGLVQWNSAWMRSPIVIRNRTVRRLVLPAPAPSLGVSVQSGWTRLWGEGARAAANRLDPHFHRETPDIQTPFVRETGGLRTTVQLQLRLFGGAIGVGLARSVDRSDSWSFGFVGGGGW